MLMHIPFVALRTPLALVLLTLLACRAQGLCVFRSMHILDKKAGAFAFAFIQPTGMRVAAVAGIIIAPVGLRRRARPPSAARRPRHARVPAGPNSTDEAPR